MATKFKPGIKAENVRRKDKKLEFDVCIKIGYSNILEKRLDSYTCTNPKYEVIFTIDNATCKDENKLHRFFEKYRHPDLNGKEWFLYSDEIYDFFETHPTIEEIRAAVPKKITHTKSQIEECKETISPIIGIMVANKIGINDSKYKSMSSSSIISDLLNKYIRSHYFASRDEFLYFLQVKLSDDEYNIIYNEVEKIKRDIEDLVDEFENLTNYESKMKYICELSEKIDKNRFYNFLNFIPVTFKVHYRLLRPKRCKKLNYQQSEIVAEYNKLLSYYNSDVVQWIYEIISVGDKLPLSSIKASLNTIYMAFFPKKRRLKAKATDIERWFDVKYVKITIDGKQHKGIKILRDLRT